MRGLSYFFKRVYQFSQSRPILNRLGGRTITYTEFPMTFLFNLFTYGPFRATILGRKMKRLDRLGRGLILCHTAADLVPGGRSYKRVFVYHGTCDTIYKANGPENKLLSEWFEYYFVTGEKDLDKLKRFTFDPEGLEGKIIKIGMFRSDPIVTKSYDRATVLHNYNIKSNGKKIVLYAPTWGYGGGTLGKCFETFAEEITKNYILIIRPHFNDKENISYIQKWQRNNRNPNLYFFPKPYHDIIDFIYISDLLIGDNSSVNYDFSLTGRPIVLVRSDDHENLFIPPDEYNIKLCCPIYDPHSNDSIIEKIEDAFDNPEYRKRIENLVKNSFYFNDGHAVDRACSFIVDCLSEMKIVDRQEVLEKYGGRFVYMDNYK